MDKIINEIELNKTTILQNFNNSFNDLKTSDDYSLFIDRIISQLSQFGFDEYEAMKGLMYILESFPIKEKNKIYNLMVELYPRAGKLFFYDICDSIDLCIYYESNLELLNYLSKKIGKQNLSEKIKVKIEEWIDDIESKIKLDK